MPTPSTASEAHCQVRVLNALSDPIAGSSDAIGAVDCLSVTDGAVQISNHRSAQPTGRGHGATAPAAHADGLSFHIQVGSANGADCLCHWWGGELRELYRIKGRGSTPPLVVGIESCQFGGRESVDAVAGIGGG